jgi:hypothetical protein
MSSDATTTVVDVATAPLECDTPRPTVRVKRCCGVLASDGCDCAEFAAQARGVFAPGRVIMCRPASEWGTR